MYFAYGSDNEKTAAPTSATRRERTKQFDRACCKKTLKFRKRRENHLNFVFAQRY